MKRFSSLFREPFSTVFIVVLIIVVLVLIGCSNSTMNTQPTVSSERQSLEEKYGDSWYLLAPNNIIASVDTTTPGDTTAPTDTTIPIVDVVRPLYGYWTANRTVEEGIWVEVLFILREDHTFTTGAALNNGLVTKWDHGIYKLDLYTLRLLFLFDKDAGWKAASYYGTGFVYYDVVFTKQDTLPEWAE